MRTFKYKDYIIHLFITRENSFGAKTVGIKSTSRLCMASSMYCREHCHAVNLKCVSCSFLLHHTFGGKGWC